MEGYPSPESYLVADRAPFGRAATGPLESSGGRQGPSQRRFEGDAASPEDPGDSRGQPHPPYGGRGHLPYAARVQRGHRHGYRLPRADPVRGRRARHAPSFRGWHGGVRAQSGDSSRSHRVPGLWPCGRVHGLGNRGAPDRGREQARLHDPRSLADSVRELQAPQLPVPEPRQEQLADPPANARLRPPRGQHLAGVLARLAAHLDAAEHPGELLDAIFGRELRDRGARGAAVGELRDPQVMMRLTRDLRQMRHAEYLSTPAESAELAAHDLRDRAADAGVHLVEYHAARRLRRARYLHRERQPRELASRGDLGERPGRLSRVGGDAELDAVDPVLGRIGVAVLRDVGFEAPARHAERLHARGDVAGELARGARAACRELLGLRAIALERLGELLAQRREIHFRALEGGELEGELPGALGELGRGHPVLARELLDRRQTPLDLLLARGVDIEGLAIALELARRLAHLDRGLLQHRQQPRELAVESGESPQRLQRPAHRSVRARALVLVELRERGVSACGEPPAVREPCALLAERLDLARPELEGLELLRLVAQELQPRVAVARLAFELERTVEEPEPRPMRDADLGGELGERAVLVEQHALRGAARQGLELMLAMDIDEQLAGLAQHLQRHRLPVEIGARAAVGSDDPPHDELVRAADRLLRQPLPELARDPGELEGARDLGALGAVAHRFRAGAPSGEQLQRIHHDRLARAGLA